MSLQRVILPEAEAELREALFWYEQQREGLGVEFLGVVEAAMLLAASTPRRWPLWLENDRYRRVVLRRFPYALFYELRADTIEFVAVAHVRREPGYWLRRRRDAAEETDDIEDEPQAQEG